MKSLRCTNQVIFSNLQGRNPAPDLRKKYYYMPQSGNKINHNSTLHNAPAHIFILDLPLQPDITLPVRDSLYLTNSSHSAPLKIQSIAFTLDPHL